MGKSNASKDDNIPRIVELRTATSRKIVRPIQKLAMPEYELIDEDRGQVIASCCNPNSSTSS